MKGGDNVVGANNNIGEGAVSAATNSSAPGGGVAPPAAAACGSDVADNIWS